MKPLISIITITYNSEKNLQDAITSIKNQTYSNIEYIIIDGNSSDSTVDIIKANAENINFWITEPDTGIADAWNKGLLMAKGELVGLLNSDDIYHPEAIETVVSSYLKYGKNTLYYGTTYTFNDVCLLRKIEKYFSMNNLSRGFGFLHTSCFVPMEVYKKIGVFNEKIKIAVDTDFLLRALKDNINFQKSTHVNYMRMGGVSDLNINKAYKEYIELLVKYNFITENYNFYIFRFNFFIPLMRLRNSCLFQSLLLQIKFLLLFLFNFLLNITPGSILRNFLLRLFGNVIGKNSSIHTSIKLFTFNKLKIGNNSVVNHSSYLDSRRGITIGNNVSIAHNTKIYTLGHDVNSPFFETKGSSVNIEDDVCIFANVQIMPGVTISTGSVIYTGSIVTKNVEPYSIMAGCPARKVANRNKQLLYKIKYNYLKAL